MSITIFDNNFIIDILFKPEINVFFAFISKKTLFFKKILKTSLLDGQ